MERDIYYKGYKIKIRESALGESPDDWEDEGIFLVYDHRQFCIQREGFDPINIHEFLITDESELWEGHRYHEYWIFPVEAYIHSGVSLSLFTGTKQCRWDSSVAGYILVKKDLLKGSSKHEEDLTLEKATKYAENLLKTWNQYLSGEVYGFIIEKPNATYSISKGEFVTLCITGTFSSEAFLQVAEEDTDWEEIDSCWGYYGEPEESGLLNEARMVIDALVEDAEEKE